MFSMTSSMATGEEFVTRIFWHDQNLFFMNLRSLTFVFNLTLKEEEYHKELLEPIESDYQSMTSQVRKRKTSPQVKGKQLTLQKVKGHEFWKVMCWEVYVKRFSSFFRRRTFQNSFSMTHNNYVMLELWGYIQYGTQIMGWVPLPRVTLPRPVW